MIQRHSNFSMKIFIDNLCNEIILIMSDLKKNGKDRKAFILEKTVDFRTKL